MVRSRRLASIWIGLAVTGAALVPETRSQPPLTLPEAATKADAPLALPVPDVNPALPPAEAVPAQAVTGTVNVAPEPIKAESEPRATNAPSTGKTAPPGATIGRGSILALFTRANPMVWVLALCSVVTLGFALERLVALRRERVIPRDFVARFLERLDGGKLDRDRAAELCRANESPVAKVFALVINEWGQPAATIRESLGYGAAGILSELKRNIRVLNGTATIAPLLGLLGTIIGMIQSFEAIGGKIGPAKGEALAQGISLALVTTAFGLAIAIVSVVAYYYLLNRVDLLVGELDDQARRVIDLVSAEGLRAATTATERRPATVPPPTDVLRHEPTRVH